MMKVWQKCSMVAAVAAGFAMGQAAVAQHEGKLNHHVSIVHQPISCWSLLASLVISAHCRSA